MLARELEDSRVAALGRWSRFQADRERRTDYRRNELAGKLPVVSAIS